MLQTSTPATTSAASWGGTFIYVENDAGGFDMCFRRDDGSFASGDDGTPTKYAYDLGGVVPLAVIEARASAVEPT